MVQAWVVERTRCRGFVALRISALLDPLQLLAVQARTVPARDRRNMARLVTALRRSLARLRALARPVALHLQLPCKLVTRRGQHILPPRLLTAACDCTNERQVVVGVNSLAPGGVCIATRPGVDLERFV